MDININASEVPAEQMAELLHANPDADIRINITEHAVSFLRTLADDIESGKKKLQKAEIVGTSELLPLFAYQFIAN